MVKRLLAYGALALGILAGSLLPPVEAQYGGYTFTAPQHTTAALPGCSAGVGEGAIAYDTTTNTVKVCNDTSAYVNISDSASTLTVGTANTIAKFNSGATDLADSLLSDDGTNITVATGAEVRLHDGSIGDDVILFGAAQDIGIYFNNSQTRLDFDATGTAGHDFRFSMFNDNDSLINFVNSDSTNQFILRPGAHTAGKNFTEIFVSAPGDPSLNGIFQMLNFDWNETEFTTDAAEVYGIGFDTFTADANAVYTGIHMGSGWNQAIRIGDGSATDDTITFGASADAEVYWDNANGRFAIDATDAATGGSVRLSWSDTAGNGFQLAQAATLHHTFIGLPDATLTSPVNMVNLGNAGTVGIMDGSDTFNILRLDVVNADHTGTGNALNILFVDSITGDPQATEIGIKVLGSAGSFDLAASFDGPVEFNTYRQDFDGPCMRRETADFTAELVTNAAVNMALCEGAIRSFVYRLDGAQASPFVSTGTAIDMDQDGIDNEGVEIILSDTFTNTPFIGWSVVGTSPAMFVRVNITIASVSGTDNMFVGWRLVESFVDDLVLATYDTYGAHVINDTAGNLQIQTGANGADGTDENDQVAAFADAATHTFEVRVATDGNFTFFIDDLQVTESNATGSAEAGDIMAPFIGMLNASDADTEMLINWIEIGEVI